MPLSVLVSFRVLNGSADGVKINIGRTIDQDLAVFNEMSSETTDCFDYGGYRVEVKVISQNGTCHFGHQVDDVIVFDGETIQGRICMSALYSFMPKVFALRYGADFPWLKDNKDVSTHACPDAFNPVVFEVRRIRD